MFRIDEDKTIHITRGDMGYITVTLSTPDGNADRFLKGEVVRLKVYKRKDCMYVELQKDVEVTEDCYEVNIHLTGEDTTIGEVINKPIKHWYEIELNPEVPELRQTIVGYDLDGEKVFYLYPEGSDVQ